MKHRRQLVTAGLVSLAAILALFFYVPDSYPGGSNPSKSPSENLSERGPASDQPSDQPAAAASGQPDPELQIVAPSVESPDGQFSPEMELLLRGIQSGQPVRVTAGGTQRDYIFRPKRVTTDGFRISAGPDTTYPSAFEVFEGRQILSDGSLVQTAKLAVVNNTLSMTYTTDEGDFLIEENASGEWVSRTLMSREKGSDWGHWYCASTPEIAGTAVSDSASPPPEMKVEISLAAAEEEEEPAIAGARVDHPFFRLGTEYDASLKDIIVLMVSSKSQTGDSSNLSSRAASYFTYAATLADVYERQLGLRFRLQEVILIPSDAPAEVDDIESESAQLGFLRDWAAEHRPQENYKWGHVMGWTNVDGSPGGTIGRAFVRKYGSSSYGFSVSERAWTWRVIVHELGHNVGARHTNGGAMNPSLKSGDEAEDFFRKVEDKSLTAAKQIYDYMSSPSRSFVTGPAPMRNPNEMPFGVDDAINTPVDTPVAFNPLANDLAATPLFGLANNLRLIEVGQVFPKAAGSAVVSGDEIVFTPAMGFAGKVWLSYTLGGNVGNGVEGWLHSADVVVTVGGSSSNPSQNPSISATDDVVATDFSGDIRINPLLNDEGKGRLSAGDVEAHNFENGTLAATDGAFHLVGASVINGNGSLSFETAEITRNGVNTQQNTGYLVYTPGASEPAQVEIEYTAEDADGNQSTASIFLNFTDGVSVTSDVPDLVESDGRVGTVTFTRSGSTAASEWVDFLVSGPVDVTGSASDVAIAGFDSFDAVQKTGRVTIPAGQSSVSLTVSAMEDALPEGAENLDFIITDLESLLIDVAADATAIHDIVEVGRINNLLGSEDFETFPLGTGLANGWTNEATAPGVWTADSGGTPSAGTGPATDHTLGATSGIYLYREADGSSDQQADLTSPTIDLSGVSDATVEFFYHMYGSDMGELRVDVFYDGSWQLDVMPALVGPQQFAHEDPWAIARFDVSPYATADFKVRFRSTTGPAGGRGTGDMAIDDFSVGEAMTQFTQAPVISGQPQSQSVSAGGSVYLSVVAEAYPAPTYQWKKDGANIPGATRSVYFISSADLSDYGSYTCEVTSGSTVTSSAALVEVIVPPVNLSATTGDGNVDLDWDDINVSNFDSYSVFRSTSPGEYGTALDTGITSSAYTDTGVTPGTTYYYAVQAVYDGPELSDLSGEVSLMALLNTEAPQVDAGGDLTLAQQVGSTLVALDATVSDADGVGGGAVTTQWSLVSGPGTVGFADASAVDTTATFTQLGTYVLRLTANDPDFESSDEISITVEVPDTDSDGLADTWENFFFGDLSQGPSDDPDGDGEDNTAEFINGTDPSADESSPISTASYLGYTATQLSGGSADLNQSAPVSLDWQEVTGQDALLRLGSGGAIEVMRSGDYFISLALPMSSNVQRSAIRAQAYVNGAPVPGLLGESSYIRSLDGHNQSSCHFAGMLSDLSAGDFVEVKVWGTGESGTVTMSTARLFVERIQPSREIFAGLSDGTASGNLNPDTAETLLWAVPQRKDAGFTHTANSGSITLVNAGIYLVSVDLPLSSSVQRVSPRVEILLDGSRVPSGSASQGYIRNQSGHSEASVHWTGLVEASAGAVLTISVIEEAAAGTVSLPTGEQASLFIEALDVSSGTYFGTATALDTGDDWNVTGNVSYSSDLILDGTLYSKPAAHQIEVAAEGDYLLIYNDALTSMEQRANPKMTVQVNGVAVPGAETKSHYIRNDGGHNASSGSLVTLLSLAANDVVSIAVETEAAAGTVDDDAAALFALIRKSAGQAFIDADGDGLDDNWELDTFGDLGEGAEDDTDDDGLSNMLERAFGTHANDASDNVTMPNGEITEDAGTDYLTITYRRLTGGTGTTGVDYTAGGLVYTVEYDIDLTDPWSTGTVVPVGGPVNNGDGTETVSLRLVTPLSDADKQFMRLKVSPAP